MKFTGQIVALKFIKKSGKNGEELRQIREEIDIMRDLKHANIVRMLDTFETQGEFCVVTEYAQVVSSLATLHLYLLLLLLI